MHGKGKGRKGENIKLVADLRHLKKSEQITNELVKKLNVEEFVDRKVSTYSGGMKRRIDIAMGLVGNPEILFLDEPTTGIDPESRQEICKRRDT